MRAAFVVPGSLATRTGGYEYDRKMIAGLRARGWYVDVSGGDMSAVPDGTPTIVDSLAFDTLAPQIERESTRLPVIALVHMPRSTESRHLAAPEGQVLDAASLVVVTGKTALAEIQTRYGISGERVLVIEPGTDDAPIARGSGGSAVHIVCVASLTAQKGHDVLLRALARVPHDAWRLTCAGSLGADTAATSRVRAEIAELGVGDCVTLAGELGDDELAKLYDRADLFALATTKETYCMAVAEALARGIPVVSTRTGAIPELVGGDAGLLVQPGCAEAFARALALAVTDSELRRRLAGGAKLARARLRRWDLAVAEMGAALARVVANG